MVSNNVYPLFMECHVKTGIFLLTFFFLTDPNPWELEMTSGWLISFSVVLASFGVVAATLGIVELVNFIRTEGGLLGSVQVVSLASIIFGSLCKLLNASRTSSVQDESCFGILF